MTTTMMADRLQEAMQRVKEVEDEIVDEIVGEIGREAVTQVALRPPAPTVELDIPATAAEREARRSTKIDPDEDRQRILDALAGDLDEVANRHRARLGRRVCSASDARIKRIAFEQFRSMAGPEGGADNDPTWRTNAPPETTSD